MNHSYLTRLEGVPDSREINCGMAHFPGTGPHGKTCGNCKHRGLVRQSSTGTWSERLQQLVFRSYRTTQCAMFKRLSGKYGPSVKKEWKACKYFESNEKATAERAVA